MLRFVVLALIAACASEDFGRAEQALSGERLVVSQRVWAAPAGADGEPRYTLAWERPDGTRTPSGLGVVTHAREWMGGALYVDPARTLRLDDTVIALDVVDAPAISPDGARFAYVVVEEDSAGTHAAVHVASSHHDVVWDRSRLAIGALRFSPDGAAVFGVGAINGGVAGLHVIDADGARCLTNCDLRTGEAWTDFVAPPTSASALRFDGDRVEYDAPQGRVTRVWRR